MYLTAGIIMSAAGEDRTLEMGYAISAFDLKRTLAPVGKTMKLDALAVHKMTSGDLCLHLSEQVSWEGFPKFAKDFLPKINGVIIEKIDFPDARLWKVKIGKSILS